MPRPLASLLADLEDAAKAAEARADLLARNWYRNATLRAAIALRDGHTCAYCGVKVGTAEGASLSLDHIQCQSHGGGHSPHNLVAVCPSCNSSRGNRAGLQRARLRHWETGKALREVARRQELDPIEALVALVSTQEAA